MEGFEKQLKAEVSDYEATREVHNMGERQSITDHDHYFTRVTGGEAACKCGWGLFLGLRDQIRDGHLYVDGTLIV